MYIPGTINNWNTSTCIYIICTYYMYEYSCSVYTTVYTIRRTRYSFFVFASPSLVFGSVSLLLLSLIQFLCCCCCRCWCAPLCVVVPPPAAAACMPPAPITCSFCCFCWTTFIWRTSPTRSLLFCHRRSLEQVDGEKNYTKSGQTGIFWSTFLDGG